MTCDARNCELVDWSGLDDFDLMYITQGNITNFVVALVNLRSLMVHWIRRFLTRDDDYLI